MAWSAVSIPTSEALLLVRDKPTAAVQAIPARPAYAKLIEDAQTVSGDITTWIDRSETSSPTSRVYDGYSGHQASSATAESMWLLVFDLGTEREFDSLFFLNHNFNASGVTNLQCIVADDNAFSTNSTLIQSFFDFSNSRLAYIFDPWRYTARFIMLRFIAASPWTFRLGEIVVGRRRQLRYKLNRPYDDLALSEEAAVSKTQGGVIHKTNYSRRGFELTGDLEVDNDTDRDNLVAFFRQCRGPFVWIENPLSATNDFHFMIRDGGFSLPRVDANLRRHRLVANEQGPESQYLDVEKHG